MPEFRTYQRQITPTAQTGYSPQTAAQMDLASPRPVLEATKQLADIGTELATKMREADHVANLANANATFADEYSKAMVEFQANPEDYEKHEQNFVDRMTQVRDNLTKNINDPVSRNQITANFDAAINQNKINVRQLATNQKIDKSTGLGLSAAQKLYDLNDADGGNAVISEMMKTGLISQKQGIEMIDAGTQQVKVSRAQDAMSSWVQNGKDPFKFLENNPNLGLTQQQRKALESYGLGIESELKQRAREAKQQVMDANDRQFLYAFNAGSINLKQLNQALLNGTVSDSVAQSIFGYYRSKADQRQAEARAESRQANALAAQERMLQAYAKAQVNRYEGNKDWSLSGIAPMLPALGPSAGKQVLDQFFGDIEDTRNKYMKNQVSVKSKQYSNLIMTQLGYSGGKVADMPVKDQNKYYTEMANFYSVVDQSGGDVNKTMTELDKIIQRASVDTSIQTGLGFMDLVRNPNQWAENLREAYNTDYGKFLGSKYGVLDTEIPPRDLNTIVNYLNKNGVTPNRTVILEAYRQGSR